jgi:hypothetical protein
MTRRRLFTIAAAVIAMRIAVGSLVVWNAFQKTGTATLVWPDNQNWEYNQTLIDADFLLWAYVRYPTPDGYDKPLIRLPMEMMHKPTGKTYIFTNEQYRNMQWAYGTITMEVEYAEMSGRRVVTSINRMSYTNAGGHWIWTPQTGEVKVGELGTPHPDTANP